MIQMTNQQLEQIWKSVIDYIGNYDDLNSKAVLVQIAIAEYGPVPNSMADAVRKAMKPTITT